MVRAVVRSCAFILLFAGVCGPAAVLAKASSAANPAKIFADRILEPPVDRSSPQIQVGQNVQISAARPKLMHGEMRIAADPRDYRKLVACSITTTSNNWDWPGWHEWDVLYYSHDEGLTWAPRVDSGFASDPTCEYTNRGTALFIANRLTNLTWNRGVPGIMDVFRSADGGQTWKLATHLPFVDSEILTPPGAPEVPDEKNIWVGGTCLLMKPSLKKSHTTPGAYSFVSTNDGVSFSKPILVQRKPHASALLYSGGMATLSNGTHVYSFMDVRYVPNTPGHGNITLETARVHPGGTTFSRPTIALSVYGNYQAQWTESRTMLAADQSNGPFKNRLYAVWPDWRTGRGEILLSYSDDAGTTWTTPRIISDDRAFGGGRFGPDDSQATVAVNKSGVVGVAWYSRAESPDDLGWTIRFRASRDGGRTWLPSVRVSSAANSFAVPRDWSNYITVDSVQPPGLLRINAGFHSIHTFTGGDYAGLTADAAGVFHPVWSGNRTGLSQMWTAQVRVPGSAHRPTTQRAGTLVLPTENLLPPMPMYAKGWNGKKQPALFVEASHATYDAASQTFSMLVRLRNVSSKRLHGPWTLRVTSVESGHGDASVANADNGDRGVGATWTFHARNGEVLAPMQFSQVRRISLRLVHERPFDIRDFWTPVGDPLLLAGIHYRLISPKP